MTRRALLLGAILGAITFGVPTPRARAHPHHDSVARADVRSGHLEVALRVAPEDLEEALSRIAGTRIHLERTPGVDGKIIRYLRAHFVLRSREGTRRRLTWVGKEVGIEEAWLYFEVALPRSGGTADHRLENSLFFEIAPTQVNRVLVRDGDRTRELLFSRDGRVHPL